MNANELREMNDEQLQATLEESKQNLFRLRLQSQTERLDAPTELRRNRRLVAQVKTVQNERKRAQAEASGEVLKKKKKKKRK